MNATKKKELWLALQKYHFDHLVPPSMWQQIRATFGGDDASTKAFAAKIARKLSWNTAFAFRAVGEYKRFVYLGVIADFSVTPSKTIDAVWHEHQLFTRAYRQFCAEVIDYTFDHTPELLPADNQTAVFSVQYMDTLALYEKEFGTKPPSEIWSIPKFNRETLLEPGYTSKKKDSGFRRPLAEEDRSDDDDDAPLFALFDVGDGMSPQFTGGNENPRHSSMESSEESHSHTHHSSLPMQAEAPDPSPAPASYSHHAHTEAATTSSHDSGGHGSHGGDGGGHGGGDSGGSDGGGGGGGASCSGGSSCSSGCGGS